VLLWFADLSTVRSDGAFVVGREFDLSVIRAADDNPGGAF
jgi:hypothetical protein